MKELSILVCCGSGLGSSLMISMNVDEVVREMGIQAQVKHSDLASARGSKADVLIGTLDITPRLEGLAPYVIALKTIFDKQEIRDKLGPVLREITSKG